MPPEQRTKKRRCSNSEESHPVGVLSIPPRQRLQSDVPQQGSSQAQGTTLTDLPQSCLGSLVARYLQPQCRWPLFQTCKTMAQAVVQHSPALTLRPTAALQGSSSRRATVLGLAAGNSDIHLCLADGALPLDTAALWRNVTTLSLNDVGLSSSTVRDLHLQHLTRLHTLHLTWDYRCTVHTAGLQQVVQAGGLPALCSLTCAEQSWAGDEETRVLRQLAPALGNHITKLQVTYFNSLAGLTNWPAVQELHITRGKDPTSELHFTPFCAHKQLRRATLPALSLLGMDNHSRHAWHLDTLTLTGRSYTSVLAHLPLQGVQCLQIDEVWADWDHGVDGVCENLGHCGCVELLPQSWQGMHSNGHTYLPLLSVHGDTPTLKLPLHTQLLSSLLHDSPEFQGALVLACEHCVVQDDEPVVRFSDLDALSQLPVGVHTLCLSDWDELAEVTWQEVINHIPTTLQHLIITGAWLSEDDLLSILEHLHGCVSRTRAVFKLTLCDDARRKMDWLHAFGKGAVASRVPAAWPEVAVGMKTAHSLKRTVYTWQWS